MNRCLKTILLPAIMLISADLVFEPAVSAQAELHHQLRGMLTYIQDSFKNEALKKASNDALSCYTSDTIPDSLFHTLFTIGDLLANNARVKEPIVLNYGHMLVTILQHHPTTESQGQVALALKNLALTYNQLGAYDKAVPLFQQAIAILEKAPGAGQLSYANCLNNFAFLNISMGRYQEALALFQQALLIVKTLRGEEDSGYGGNLIDIAYTYSRLGLYRDALLTFEQAEAVTKKTLGAEHPLYAQILTGMAYIQQRLGNYTKAISLHRQALAIRKKALGEEHTDCAESLAYLAGLYFSMKQYEQALPLYQQVLMTYKKVLGEEHVFYANNLNKLGQLYESMGKYDTSLALYHQTLAICKKALGENHPYYATACTSLAALYHTIKRNDSSIFYYQQALAIRKNVLGQDHPDYAATLTSMATLKAAEGKPSEAGALLTEATAIMLKHLSRTYATLSEKEKLTFLNNEARQFSYLPSLLLTQRIELPSVKQQIYQTELILKGMVLEDQQGVLTSIRSNKDSATVNLYEQWRSNKTFLGKQLLQPLAKRVLYFDSLEDATTRQEQQLSLRSSAFQAQLSSLSLSTNDIAQKLHPGEAAIEFIRFPLYNRHWTDSIMYAALLLLPQDTAARFIPLFEERQLAQVLKRFTGSATAEKGVIVGSGKSSDTINQLIWKPVEQYLAGVHTVFYAPAGLLHRIAFQALRADSTHLLIDKYQLNQVLSTRAVALPAAVGEKLQSVSLWGDIAFNQYPSPDNSLAVHRTTRGIMAAQKNTGMRIDTSSSFSLYNADNRGLRAAGWEPLPDSKKEIDTLTDLFKRSGIAYQTLCGSSATEEAFKAMEGKSPQVLHLATHGFFLPVKELAPKNNDAGFENTFTIQQNPMFRSGLVLAGANQAWKGEPTPPGKEDGILTAYEIAQLDLSHTDLVVLSACETALGDLQGNEGVIGLQRALKMAGVKQMIISLWQVSDKVTMELMTLFYKNWLNGMTTREALRQAQLAIKQKYKYPYYWAAFTLVE